MGHGTWSVRSWNASSLNYDRNAFIWIDEGGDHVQVAARLLCAAFTPDGRREWSGLRIGPKFAQAVHSLPICRRALKIAEEQGSATGMVAAIKEIGILSGKRIERRESGEPGEFEKLEQMSAAELVAYIQQLESSH
jgi:hypothetical protein